MTGGDAGPEDGLEGNPKTSQVDGWSWGAWGKVGSTGWVPSTMYGCCRVILLKKNAAATLRESRSFSRCGCGPYLYLYRKKMPSPSCRRCQARRLDLYLTCVPGYLFYRHESAHRCSHTYLPILDLSKQNRDTAHWTWPVDLLAMTSWNWSLVN